MLEAIHEGHTLDVCTGHTIHKPSRKRGGPRITLYSELWRFRHCALAENSKTVKFLICISMLCQTVCN